MHICMVLGRRYPPDVRVTKETTALVAAGHEVTVLCRPHPDRPPREEIDGVQVVRLFSETPHPRLRRLGSAAVNLVTGVHPAWQSAIASLVDTHGVDAIHVHDLPLVRTALRVGRTRDVPVLADLHENYPEGSRQWRKPYGLSETLRRPSFALHRLFMPVARYKRIEADVTPRVDRVITVTPEAARHYRDDCGVAGDRITVVSNTVDLAAFDPESTPVSGFEDEFVVAYVGSFSGPHRGLETAIDAFAALTDRVPNARLLLVGAGADQYERTLRERARTRGVADRLTMTGWVDFEAVPAYIAAADAGIVPHADTAHTQTTVPHKLFQYMAMATPVVVTDMQALDHVVTDTSGGLVVPAENPDRFADALATLATDPDLAAELGRNARRGVEETYNWSRDAQRLTALYDTLH